MYICTEKLRVLGVLKLTLFEIQDMVQNRLVQNEMWFQLLKSNLKSMFSKINIS